jgi:tRNA modification GTPase
MVTRRRQWEALRRAGQALGDARRAVSSGLPPELVSEHLREALGALGEVTGERFTEEVLDSIFSAFCIGK